MSLEEARLLVDALETALREHQQEDVCATLAQLRVLNVQLTRAVKAAKSETYVVRDENDRLRLGLEALRYEQQQLRLKIDECSSEVHDYEKVPLASESDFLARNPDRQTSDPKTMMLARLDEELSERRRIELDRKRLLAEKSKLVQDNRTLEHELEALDGLFIKQIISVSSISRLLLLVLFTDQRQATEGYGRALSKR
ncbi:hypothetical protein PYCC9005_002737 [Savitreella phatthalungensis]